MNREGIQIQTSPYLFITKERNVYNMLTGVTEKMDDDLFSVLKSCREQVLIEDILAKYSYDNIYSLFRKRLLLNVQEIWNMLNITSLEIETCTHCNWKCTYCPVSSNKKIKQIMTMDLFDDIISKAEMYKGITTVLFNSYNEPTLDYLFEKRIERLAQTDMKLQLHTNASGLSRARTDLLKDSNVLSIIYFNLPSVEKNVFEQMTGYSNLHQILKNIDYAIESNLPVRFSIQGTKQELKENIPVLKKRYGFLIDDNLDNYQTFDRAGLLDNQYSQGVHIKGKLHGACKRVLNNLYLSVCGDAFVCCNDFFQKTAYGNIRDGSIDDLIFNKKAQQLRKMICGVEDAPDDFLCRKCKDMQNAMLHSVLSRPIRSRELYL